jgi:hypothetical protein
MAPSQVKVESHDIVLGLATRAAETSVVALSPPQQQSHAMIWGRTGSGKSRLLQSLFLQHLSQGHGVCLIEPHHDLAFDTLAYLVQRGYFRDSEAFDHLVYLDWGNGAIVPFNVLALNQYPPKTPALHALESMLRVWPELKRAPSFQTLFLASMVVLVQNNLPLTSLHDVLLDSSFREHCLKRVSDPLILQTAARITRMNSQETGSALRRAFLLSFNDLTRLSLGQPDNLLNIRQLMDQGQSLIVNLGNIPDAETRKLIGALLLVQIEQAALSRTDIPPKARRAWTVLIDEWPSFAAADGAIGTILDQTRKFGLRLYLAAQATGQVGSERLQAALENCAVNITFGLGRESAVDQSRQIATLDPLRYRADPYTGRPQRVSNSQQFEDLAQDLEHLSPQEAYVKVASAPAVKIKTLTVPDARPDPFELRQVLATYRARYQRPRHDAEARLPRVPKTRAAGSASQPFALFADTENASLFPHEPDS